MMPAHRKPARKKRIAPAAEPGDWRVPATQRQALPPNAPTPPQVSNESLLRRFNLRVNYLESVGDAPSDFGYPSEAPYYADENDVIPISGLKRVGRIFWATVLYLPLVLLLSTALFNTLYEARGSVQVESLFTSLPVWYTLIGAGSLICLFFMRVVTPLLMYLYVLGHEATHAITSLLCFRGVGAFKVGLDGGYVDTEADNPLVALSPYFVPLWLIIWTGGVWAVQRIYPFAHYDEVFYSGFGFWLCFHIYWTIWIIPREQPDFLENGIYFSILFIGLMNLIMLIGILTLFDVISWTAYYENVRFVWSLVEELVAYLSRMF